MNFKKLCQECEEVEISNGVVTFTGYHADRNDYHTDRGWWCIPLEEVVDMIKNNYEEFSECETDEEKIEWLSEMGSEEFNCGGSKSRSSDYDTLSYNIKSLDFQSVDESLESPDDYTEFCYIEDYPYRYGTYSGTYNMKTDKFEEFYCDGDSSPCGGPDYAGFNVTPYLLNMLMNELKTNKD